MTIDAPKIKHLIIKGWSPDVLTACGELVPWYDGFRFEKEFINCSQCFQKITE